MKDNEMTAVKYRGLPERVRETIEDLLLFYGECAVWFEDGGFHMAVPGCAMKPENTSDYESFGEVTRETLPNLWALRFGRAS